MATERKLTGKVPREAIRTLAIPRLPQEIIAGFARLIDLTGTVSDAMDNLGLAEARKIDAGDSRRKQDIAAGADIAVLVQKKYK